MTTRKNTVLEKQGSDGNYKSGNVWESKMQKKKMMCVCWGKRGGFSNPWWPGKTNTITSGAVEVKIKSFCVNCNPFSSILFGGGVFCFHVAQVKQQTIWAAVCPKPQREPWADLKHSITLIQRERDGRKNETKGRQRKRQTERENEANT